MNFMEAKTAYTELRENERTMIVNHLDSREFKVSKSTRAGKGLPNYTAGRTIAPFDLTNWKFITASRGGKEIFISLQAFDKDPHSGNHHVLVDRIGLYAYSRYDSEEAFSKMIVTDIDLPMNDEKFAKLDALIDQQLKEA